MYERGGKHFLQDKSRIVLYKCTACDAKLCDKIKDSN